MMYEVWIKLDRKLPITWKQYVMFKEIKSNLKSMLCGIPQGSILGPILFLVYINDLANISNKLSFILFADDTNVLYAKKIS